MTAREWWLPYESADARGARMRNHAPEKALVDAAIDAALAAEAASWFTRKEATHDRA